MIYQRDLEQFSPRSGLNENSPALQCWEHSEIRSSKPAKRAADDANIHSDPQRFVPSDESLGYFQSSAARTVMLLTGLVFFIAMSSTSSGQTPTASPTPSVGDVTVPP